MIAIIFQMFIINDICLKVEYEFGTEVIHGSLFYKMSVFIEIYKKHT